MRYSPRITIEDYVMAMLRADLAMLPPRTPGCYSVWFADFQGSEPTAAEKGKFVIVGMTDKGELLERVSKCVVESIGITGTGTLPGNVHSFFSTTGRLVFLAYKNAEARRLLITWRDDCCPLCEEHRIYRMFSGGARHLKQRPVGSCRRRLSAATP